MAMIHPPDLYKRFGKSEEEFEATFEDKGNGTFIAKKSFDFVHAVGTSKDRPKTIAKSEETKKPVEKSTPSLLWQACTGKSIQDSKCAILNCTSDGCSAKKPQKAGATAHVYLTSQTSAMSIKNMLLLPTCKAANTDKQSSSCNTQYPQKGDVANVLQARSGTKVIFIQIDDDTAGHKGGIGRGRGQGGTFGGPYGKAGRGGGMGSGKGGSGKGSAPYY